MAVSPEHVAAAAAAAAGHRRRPRDRCPDAHAAKHISRARGRRAAGGKRGACTLRLAGPPLCRLSNGRAAREGPTGCRVRSAYAARAGPPAACAHTTHGPGRRRPRSGGRSRTCRSRRRPLHLLWGLARPPKQVGEEGHLQSQSHCPTRAGPLCWSTRTSCAIAGLPHLCSRALAEPIGWQRHTRRGSGSIARAPHRQGSQRLEARGI